MEEAQKYILSIFASPFKKGYSSEIHDIFLSEFIDQGLEVRRVYVYDLNISSCTACGYCRKASECIIQDDMAFLYDDIRNADLITISSPVYFSSVPGRLKDLIDRCQVLWNQTKREKKSFVLKDGFFMSIGGAVYENMFTASILTVRHLFNTVNAVSDRDDYILLSGSDDFDELPAETRKKALEMGGKYCTRLLSGS